jgi:membrane-associated phospholipid phosphatase
MLSLAFLVCRRWRPVALMAILPMAVVFSVNRIAFGGHFLSDVLMSWMIVGFLMAALAQLMLMPGRMDAIDRALIRDGAASWSPAQRLWVSRILTAKTENTAAKT